MDINTADPYEQKLYNMFKSFDTQLVDSLDKEALIKLCTMLELKDRGPKLVANLIDNKRNNRVTFREFKEGLLNLLGTDGEDDDVCEATSPTSPTTNRLPQRADNEEVTDIIRKENGESKSREVSPKLVVGGRKYGRRSRPQSAVAFDSSPSDSDDGQSTYDQNTIPAETVRSKRVQRSASQSDMHGTTNIRRIRAPNVGNGGGGGGGVGANGGTKLKRCASLPAQKQRQTMIAANNETRNLKTQLESSVESLGNLDIENLSNSLYVEWNKCDRINAGSYGGLHDTQTNQKNHFELESIFVRVGLQTPIAAKLADEVYAKLGLRSNQSISFNEFLSLIQCDTDLGRQAPSLPSATMMSPSTLHTDDGDVYRGTSSSHIIIDDSMVKLTQIDLHAHSDEPTEWTAESMPIEVIVDMWEMAHVKNAAGLLDDLGFTSKEINLSKLSTIIDEELQDVHTEKELTPLLRASLALCKAEVNAMQKSLRHAAYENKQLHANVRELNRRSFMLAQEVDERHANLESAAREELRQLELRHSDIVRELTAQLAGDREQWSQLNAKLEQRIKQYETDDGKHKAEMIRLRNENSALETEHESMHTQIADLLEMNIKLNNEIVEVQQRGDDAQHDGTETEEMLELMDKIGKLQMENSSLRDKNDELVSELEEMHIELNKVKSRKQLRFDQTNSGGEDNGSSGGESSNVSTNSATKRRGDSPSKAKRSEESPRLGKLRKYHNDNSEGESETSGDWLALNSELNQSQQTNGTTSGFSQDFSSLNDHKDDEIKELKSKIVKLEVELVSLKEIQKVTDEGDAMATGVSDGDGKTHVERIQELEASLEQMQKEYEACEDYWQGKLNEERQLYEEEQRISDEKFTELLKKMAEYEEQFSATMDKDDGRLTPIEEKCQLEQQYADLEAETEEFREHARQIFEEKQQELEQLQTRVKDLERRISIAGPATNAEPMKVSDAESVASSPISYLWNQSTIQAPTRDYQNPNWNRTITLEASDKITVDDLPRQTISPIQRPHTPSTSSATAPMSTFRNTMVENVTEELITEIPDDMSSVRSFATHSVASTHSIHRSLPEILSSSPNPLREDVKRLKLIELQLQDEIKSLTHQRDGLVMELQQLQEAKPMLMQAYTRTPHPSLIQRIQQLEQKNRQLQFCLKQQHQYTESIMSQNWQQQRSEINELRDTLETQGIIINEQAQRLANSDVLVKDLYVENSQLTAAIQRLEQQRSRNNILLQHQGVGSVPGML